jgi:selenocysteine-specific elongation factor
MPIVGTAGHVDHGKSSLVQALTGRDPDRWDEEKRRGLTIDLGFAWTEIDGVEIGFVDVPGHERFIKNMLAGVVAVDCTLLVIAADSGWMPQTEEHVRVLDLLGNEHGIVALSRVDLVDRDTVELATLEIAEEVGGTVLESWPVLPVSAHTGEGLDVLEATLASTMRQIAGDTDGGFRMWVDRAFVIHGSGVVATGTVQRGSLSVDDEVELHPSGITARVRGLHHHDASVATVIAGQRAAVNLATVDLAHISRGTLLATPGTATTTSEFILSTHAARGFDSIPDRGAFHIHSGTADRSATIRKITETETLVRTADPVGAVVGDRVIVRESGRQAVVGGGTIVDPSVASHPNKDVVSDLASRVLDADTPSEAADGLLAVQGVADLADLRCRSGGGEPTIGVVVGTTAVAPWFLEATTKNAVDLASKYQQTHPKRPGIPSAELASRLDIDREVLSHVVASSDGLDAQDGAVRTIDFSEVLTPDDEASWETVRAELETSFNVPRARQLELEMELVHALIRRGDLVRIDDDLVVTSDQLDDLTARMTELEDGFTVSQFKDHFGMARRQAVPLLEWFDKSGVTKRQGDGRVVRNRVGS